MLLHDSGIGHFFLRKRLLAMGGVTVDLAGTSDPLAGWKRTDRQVCLLFLTWLDHITSHFNQKVLEGGAAV